MCAHYARASEVQILHDSRVQTQWFKARMKHLGLNEEDLGNALRRDRSVISRIINGRQPLKLDEVEPLAEALEVDAIEILVRAGTWKRKRPPTVRTAAILDQVRAGRFTEMPERPPSAPETVLVDYPRDTIFALRVSGDSMDRIAPEGSLVIVDYSEHELCDGALGVFRLDDQATFKRLRRQGAETWMQPESNNPRHGPIFPPDGRTVEAIGRVVEIRPDYGAMPGPQGAPNRQPRQIGNRQGEKNAGPAAPDRTLVRG